jgi:ferritin-like metal-binding protein YciE
MVVVDEYREQLVESIEDAHALEQHVAKQLDVLIDTTEDPELREAYLRHKEQTETHERLLRERLEDAYRRSPDPIKDVESIFVAMSKGLIHKLRPPDPARNARDAYVAEQMEIATYEILERMARRAGDWTTAEVARRNRADEQGMADAIAARWTRVVELSVRRDAVTA